MTSDGPVCVTHAQGLSEPGGTGGYSRTSNGPKRLRRFGGVVSPLGDCSAPFSGVVTRLVGTENGETNRDPDEKHRLSTQRPFAP